MKPPRSFLLVQLLVSGLCWSSVLPAIPAAPASPGPDADYRHQDRFDLAIADLALVRHTKPLLLDFAPAQAALFADAPAADRMMARAGDRDLFASGGPWRR